MISDFLQFGKGYLEIRISGRFPERFLNVCAAKGILLWDIKRTDSGSICAKISLRGFRLLPPIAHKTAVRVEILAKHGLSLTLKKYRRRKPFFIGIFLFLFSVILLNQFVWEIEITGNKAVPTEAIRAELMRQGLYVGQLRFRVNQKKIKNEMLLTFSELSWLWAEKSGSKVIVQVKEKQPVPTIFDPNDYCSVIAKKDGVIDSMIVRNGMPTVKIGDSVLKDSVLVSGMIPNERNVPTRYLQADAEIYARTWYEETKAFSCLHSVTEETGNIQKKYRLKLFGFQIPFYHTETPHFAEYQKNEEKKELSVFGKYLGITLYCDVYRETKTKDLRYSQKEVTEEGIRRLSEEIDQKTSSGAERLRLTPSCKVIDEDTVEITVIAEYLENIAQKVKMEKELPQQNATTPENSEKTN